jgi:hypothetical protein
MRLTKTTSRFRLTRSGNAHWVWTCPCMLPSTVCERVPACLPLQCVNVSLHASLYSVWTCPFMLPTTVCERVTACLPSKVCERVTACFPVQSVYMFLFPVHCVYVLLLPYGVCVYVFLLLCTLCVCVPSSLYSIYRTVRVCGSFSAVQFYTLTVRTCLYSIIHTTLD